MHRSVHAVFTSAADGDLRSDAPSAELRSRRSAIAAGSWTWLRQVHGSDVVVVERPGDHAGARADAAVTTTPGAVLAVQTADCAGVLLAGAATQDPDGSVRCVGVAHAGWRGLGGGVLQRTVEVLRTSGADRVTFRLGPCISPDAYEFGVEDLDRLAGRYGDAVRGETSWGAPALDLRAAVRAALAEVGAVDISDGDPSCTATDDRYFSFRARGDVARQAAVTWMTIS